MGVGRRGFLTGLASLLAAPAIVRAANLMPIAALPLEPVLQLPYRQPNPMLVFDASSGMLDRTAVMIMRGLDAGGAEIVERFDVQAGKLACVGTRLVSITSVTMTGSAALAPARYRAP